MGVLSFTKGFFIDEIGRWKNLYYILLAQPQSLKTRSIVERNAKDSGLILDIGSRKSPYTRRLKRHITCLDKASETDGYLGFTDDLVKKMSTLPNTEVVLGSAMALPFEDKTFDAVLCVEVIEHIDDDERALSQIARVMKPNGFCLLTTPNGDIIPNVNPHHYRHYNPTQLSEKLEKYFDDVKSWTICPWPNWLRLIHRLFLKLQATRHIRYALVYSILRNGYILLDALIPGRILDCGTVIVARVAKPKVF